MNKKFFSRERLKATALFCLGLFNKNKKQKNKTKQKTSIGWHCVFGTMKML